MQDKVLDTYYLVAFLASSYYIFYYILKVNTIQLLVACSLFSCFQINVWKVFFLKIVPIAPELASRLEEHLQKPMLSLLT